MINGGKRFTQLSALRTDGEWNAVDAFNEIMDPGKDCRNQTENVYLGGISPARYRRGVSAKTCVRRFENWLTPEDEIWVWTKSIRASLSELWEKYAGNSEPKVRALKLPELTWLPDSPYDLLQLHGEDVPLPQCRAENEVEVMRRALCLPETQCLQLLSEEPVTLRRTLDLRLRNRTWAEHTDFTYIYLKNSPVFHRRECPLWTVAEKKSDLFGSSSYKTASKSRRPCKHCKPEPPPEPVPEPVDPRQCNREWVLSTNFNYIYLKNSPVFHRADCPLWTSAKNRADIFGSVTYETAAGTRRPCKHCIPMPQTVPTPEAETPKQKKKKAASTPNPQALLSVHMVSGDNIFIRANNIVGWCHYKLHKGCLNQPLYVSHDCSGKQCAFFEANPCSSYLKGLKNKQDKKTQANMQRKMEKEAQIKEENRLVALKELWQQHADSLKLKIMLVRVVKEGDNAYRVLYVSDNNSPDENLYGNLIKKARLANPALRITLRHVRDVDGHCVTINEFLKRRPA